MSYETDLKKLQKLWEGSESNSKAITEAQIQQAHKQAQILGLPSRELLINQLLDIGGEWQGISTLMTTPYQIAGFKWQITKTIPESWIPNIRINIGYKYAGGDPFAGLQVFQNTTLQLGGDQGSTGGQIVSTGFSMPVFQMPSGYQGSAENSKNIPTLERTVTVTWKINLAMAALGTATIPDFEAKLYFTLIDPSLFT